MYSVSECMTAQAQTYKRWNGKKKVSIVITIPHFVNSLIKPFESPDPEKPFWSEDRELLRVRSVVEETGTLA